MLIIIVIAIINVVTNKESKMFNHVFLNVSDFNKSAKFYEASLTVMGLEVNLKTDEVMIFGSSAQKYLFFINQAKSEPTRNMHLAFNAKTNDDVVMFYEAALANGGTSHGKPGLRTEHDVNYYAAYVKDPDGNNIEAVCNKKN